MIDRIVTKQSAIEIIKNNNQGLLIGFVLTSVLVEKNKKKDNVHLLIK